MARTTKRGKDLLPPGFTTDDLRLAKWFLNIVATIYPGPLHSHAPVIPASDKQGRRNPTSLSALFHEQWPDAQLSDILAALACAGVITSPQPTAGSATKAEPCGYVFRVVKRPEPRPQQQLRQGRQKQREEVG
jgi:hypothetical protein